MQTNDALRSTDTPNAGAAVASAPAPRIIDAALSERMRFWSLMAMVLLVYVHAFNLHPRYLAPMTLVEEAATWDNVLQYLLANGLLRFRIPILFAISGYLFAWRDDGTTSHGTRLRRRVRTLGVPYLAWSAIAIGITWTLEHWAVTRGFVVAAGLSPFQPDAVLVSQYSTGQLLQRWLLIPAAFQLWFLRTLIALTVLYPLLRVLVSRWPRAFFALALLVWLPGGGIFFVESEGILFFTLGVWLAMQHVDVVTRPRWLNVRVLLALWLTVCGIKTWWAFAQQDYTSLQSIGMLFLHRVGEVAGLLTAWFGSDRLVRAAMSQSWYRWLTAFSFMIFALHVPLLNYATEAALAYGAQLPHISIITYLVVPALTIAFSVIVGAALRRLSRPTYAVLTGGRGL